MECPICLKVFQRYQWRVPCSNCKVLFHHICLPTNVRNTVDKLTWKCTSCEINVSGPELSAFPKLNLNLTFDNETSDLLTFPKAIDDFQNCLSHITVKKGLKFGCININGLRGNHIDLDILLKKFNFDVLSCQESKLDQNCLSNRFEVSNYDLFRSDREFRSGGGTVIYFNKCTVMAAQLHHEIEFSPETEVFIFKLTFTRAKPILFISIYRRPESSEKYQFINSLEQLLSWLIAFKLEIVIMGDFNFDFLKRDPTMKSLSYITSTFGLNQLISLPTRGKALLDHCYVSKKEKFVQSDSFKFAGSDHNLLVCVRNFKSVGLPTQVIKFTEVRKKQIVDRLCLEFSSLNWNHLYSLSHPKYMLMYFSNMTSRIVSNICPTKSRRVKPKHLLWIDKEILDLMKIRDDLFKKSKNGDVSILNQAKRLKNRVKMLLSAKEKKFNVEYMSKISLNSTKKNIWRIYEETNGVIHPKKETQIPSLKVNSVVTDDFDDICAHLNNTFEPSKNLYTFTDLDNFISEISFVDLEFDDQLKVTESEVTYSIGKVKRGTTDFDFISTSILIACISSLCIPLAIIFSQCLKFGYFPDSFKKAIVKPLFKGKGLKCNPSSYRPISNTPFLSKLFEKIIQQRLIKLLRINNVLIEEQHGFRTKRSCTTAASILSQEILNKLKVVKGRVFAVFIDLMSAFPSVNRLKLLSKIKSLNILDPFTLKLLADYLNKRAFKLKFNNQSSKEFDSYLGVPQGTILGPLLFLIYINDITEAFNLNCIKFLLFADDLVIFNDDFKVLQSALNSLSTWFRVNDLIINVSKTKFMVFCKTKVAEVFTLILEGLSIERVTSFRYLGIVFDECLSFKDQRDTIEARISSSIGVLMRICRRVNLQMFTLLVNAYVLSFIDQSSIVWGFDKMFKERVQKRINKLLVFKMLRFKKKFGRLDLTLYTNDEINVLIQRCNLLTIPERISRFELFFVFEVLHELITVNYLSDLFKVKVKIRNSRSSNDLPVVNSVNASFSKCIKIRLTDSWNSLPNETKEPSISIIDFQNNVLKFLMKKRFQDLADPYFSY